jgi:hypothetical protein
MIPVKPYFVQKKGGRGSVVFHSERRELNIYTSVNVRLGRSYNTCVKSNNPLLNRAKGLDEITQLKNRNTLNPNYINKQLFRILRFDDTWVSVYQRLSASTGSFTSSVDNKTIDSASLFRLQKIKIEVLSGRFQ